MIFRRSTILWISAAFALLLVAAPSRLRSQAAPPEERAAVFQVGRSDSRIIIDGRPDEEGWRNAAVLDLPFEWQPGDNIPAPVRTECLVTYDLNNLYVAFRCYDPEPKKIRARLMDRDDTDTLILDDHVSFMVDAFNDERRAFQFRINPLGVQADAIFSEMEGYEDFSWDAIWKAAGRIEDWGYSLEAAIPLNQLRFKSSTGEQTWGFSAERSWPRGVRHRITSHRRSRNSSCVLCQFNKLTGFLGIKPGRNIELNPTLIGDRTDAMNPAAFPDGSLEKGKAGFEPGLTAKWGITPNVILNATLNPDFSQVEADAAQLEINRRFALYYPEKRPFFLEGADFFLTPIQAVFTRTVVEPEWGLKTTGKVGRTAFGVFADRDRYNNLIFPSNQGSFSVPLDQDVTGGVFRLRQDIGAMSTLGLLYTGRAGEGYGNHVAGADAFLRFGQKHSLTLQFLHSETRYPADLAAALGQSEKHGGNALLLQYTYYSRNWIFGFSYNDISPGFRADFGYVPRVDIREGTVLAFRQFWGRPGQWFHMIRLGLLGQAVSDYKNDLTDRILTAGFLYQGPLNAVLNIHANSQHFQYNGRTFDLVNSDLRFQISPLSGALFGWQVKFGQDADYVNIRPARVASLGPTAAFSLGAHLNVFLSHAFERLSFEGGRIYTANLSQAKLVYNFSVRSYVRAIVQYNNLERNTSVYLGPTESKTRGLFTQLLFSYKINPRTVLFLGYSDNARGVEEVDITRLNRTFFLKLAYALQI